jgi:DNA-binding IclR family transcriptional regulator
VANQSIQRAAHILSLFSYSQARLRVSDIAKELDLPLGTVHGLVSSLEEVGFLAQAPNSRKYTLGLKLHELGAIQTATMDINQKSSMPVGYLARETGLVGRVGVLERDAVVVTLSTQPLEGGSAARPLVPSYCSSLGRAILAHLPEDEVVEHLNHVELVQYTSKTIVDEKALWNELRLSRQRGYAVTSQELLMHLASIGAPIWAPGCKVVGAVSLNGPPHLIDGEKHKEFAQMVMDTAGEISSFMGHHMEPRFKGASQSRSAR